MTQTTAMATRRRSKRRLIVERSWIAGVVLFTVARFAVAYSTLERYGMNMWLFGLIDLATALPYGIATARLVGAIVDRQLQGAARWGVIASASFLAPYLYVAWAGRDVGLPTVVYVVLAILVVCFGANAILGVGRRVRQTRFAATTTIEPT